MMFPYVHIGHEDQLDRDDHAEHIDREVRCEASHDGLHCSVFQFHRMNRHMDELERRLDSRLRYAVPPPSQDIVPTLVSPAVPVLPRIIESPDHRKLVHFEIDVTGFQPEEIHIKTMEGKLVVFGSHEESTDDFAIRRHFSRSVDIPEGAHLEHSRSRLSPGGLLTIDAPFEPVSSKNSTEMPHDHVAHPRRQVNEAG